MAKHNREPIGNTCPAIDSMKKDIKWALVSERDLRHLNEDDLRESARQMSIELEKCLSFLEEMRTANDVLRQWGVEEAEKVDELESELEEINLTP